MYDESQRFSSFIRIPPPLGLRAAAVDGDRPFVPADMKTVEEQCEDVPFDMDCYKDADGHVWDFAFGLNWSGVIADSRTARYAR